MAQPNLNPEPGQLFTYNGPTLGASWEDAVSADLFEALVLAWFQSLPTSPGSSGTFWNNGGTLAYIP